MEIDILGGDIVHPTAKHNGYNYLAGGKFVKTIKEANQTKKEWKENNDWREHPYHCYKIHNDYNFLLRKTKEYITLIIIYAMPDLKFSLKKRTKKDLINIIEKNEILYFDY